MNLKMELLLKDLQLVRFAASFTTNTYDDKISILNNKKKNVERSRHDYNAIKFYKFLSQTKQKNPSKFQTNGRYYSCTLQLIYLNQTT